MFKANMRLFTPLMLLLLGGEGILLARQPATMTAQNGGGKIEGVVTDPDRAPITGTLVSLQGVEVDLHRNRRTDKEGRFEFPRLPIGSYTIQIESIPFEITRGSVDLSSASKKPLPLGRNPASQCRACSPPRCPQRTLPAVLDVTQELIPGPRSLFEGVKGLCNHMALMFRR